MTPGRALLVTRILQGVIFGLGGLCALSLRSGDWGFAILYAMLAIVAYLILTAEINLELEDE